MQNSLADRDKKWSRIYEPDVLSLSPSLPPPTIFKLHAQQKVQDSSSIDYFTNPPRILHDLKNPIPKIIYNCSLLII